MSRVFITGDTHKHIDIHKLNSLCFKEGNKLNKNDIVIICGDAGFVWGNGDDEKWIDWISRKPWITVFVDGNHENHPLLNSYPEVYFKGAKANKITNSLYHIKRGEIMTINNKKFFCFGGAFSHDIKHRTEGLSWWQDELPVQEEIDNALNNLERCNFKVDFIISHDVPSSINMILGHHTPTMNYYDSKYIHICNFFENIKDMVDYKVWFAGHYHEERRILDMQILYNDIVEIIDDDYQRVAGLDDVLSISYSKAELIDHFIKEDLYILQGRIDTFEHFHTFIPPVLAIDYFNNETTEDEMKGLSHSYNTYLIKKCTRED